jgi:hypothetical protein
VRATPPYPGWGQRRLAHELARIGIDPPPGLTSIYRALVRNGLIQPRPRRRPKADYRRWERDRPMELWQLDVMGGVWLASAQELKVVTGLDDHSRFCVMAGLVDAQQVLDDWVDDYNTHQPARPATLRPTEVTRRLSTRGLIGVCYQQVSAGRHLAGQIVTVRLQPTVLQVFFAGQLIRTVPRRSTKEVVQLRAHRPHKPKQRPTTT